MKLPGSPAIASRHSVVAAFSAGESRNSCSLLREGSAPRVSTLRGSTSPSVGGRGSCKGICGGTGLWYTLERQKGRQGLNGPGESRTAARATQDESGSARSSASNDTSEASPSSPASSPNWTVEDRMALLELYTSGSDEEDNGPSRYSAANRREASPSDAAPGAETIAEKMRLQYKVVVKEEVTIPIGPNAQRRLVRKSPKPVTRAQQRNMQRAEYMERVSKRSDSTFFTIVASSILLPPIVILAAAYATGYLEFLN